MIYGLTILGLKCLIAILYFVSIHMAYTQGYEQRKKETL